MVSSRAIVGALSCLLMLTLSAPARSSERRVSDAEIKRLLIQESIADYPGNCPCPYNTARNGSSCGRRSAYNRPGGAAPLCYPSDVTAEMVADYRAAHGG